MTRASNPRPAGTPTPVAGLTFVDTHVHLDEPAFDPDRDQVITRAHEAGVARIVNIGYRPARWLSGAALAARHPDVLLVLGLLPHHADEYTDETLPRLAAEIGRSGALAVGEIGLDYFREGPHPELQRDVFAAQLELAAQLDLPVVIHQRSAEEDLMAVLERSFSPSRVVLHSFDGTERLAAFASERGYFFGLGGLFTRAAAVALRSIVAGLPLDRVLLETDSPYLVPAGVKDRRNEPSNVPWIASRVADLFGCSVEEIARHTTANAETAFGLPAGARR